MAAGCGHAPRAGRSHDFWLRLAQSSTVSGILGASKLELVENTPFRSALVKSVLKPLEKPCQMG
jgi:hypothetical protein